MEPFYYSKMNKMQQAAYHAICQGILQMEKEIQVPRSLPSDLICWILIPIWKTHGLALR